MEALLRSMNFNLELYVCRYDNHPTLFRRLCIVLTFCYKANCRSNIQKAITKKSRGAPDRVQGSIRTNLFNVHKPQSISRPGLDFNIRSFRSSLKALNTIPVLQVIHSVT
ncbi:hypothetical protein FOXG_18259 [Fusarium oxysporum f. sp. lycopersici 4287]|uniref:Uncharacterized protein n=1 Tax=Fusarium oxysporum f. sp. lycopersici (strain 4287 / CBS 123668 / FGSC 9935 / NRRL 34936) TaxID=426428 RepID=A0A0J9UDZ1_FUSO4|nr:hypothetical protein FOXG_18259 [Fusarium oxysporum f. sp. lycopersici 4287]KNA97598.1 hypothetical protein FOXG_18259 [Fusarium oxysporum f. sp. lycopersici 4287]